MTRRASLPGADELFRRTVESEPAVSPEEPGVPAAAHHVEPALGAVGEAKIPEPAHGARKPRHDEKVTFYCTATDLDRLEKARLALRTDHRIGSDRGKIVRAALAEVLDDFEARGESSALVRHLR